MPERSRGKPMRPPFRRSRLHPVTGIHLIVLPGGGYSQHVAHEGEPIVGWLNGLSVRASVFRYPLQVRHPEPLNALRTEIRRLRDDGAERIAVGDLLRRQLRDQQRSLALRHPAILFRREREPEIRLEVVLSNAFTL